MTSVQLTVRPTVAYSGTVQPSGSGWSSMLNALADLRANDGAAADEYYYGIVQPASSHNAYCGGQACVAGLGFTAPLSATYNRAAVGLGYTGGNYVAIAQHEMGHLHGRGHAPCGGTNGSDTSFPYPSGVTGTWGYDLLAGVLLGPNTNFDVMGYCKPRWISDYNFTNLFERIQDVASADIRVPETMQGLTWDRVFVAPDGTVSAAEPIDLDAPPTGEPVDVVVSTRAGEVSVTGQMLTYDHVDGGLLFVPPTVAGPRVLHAAWEGIAIDMAIP